MTTLQKIPEVTVSIKMSIKLIKTSQLTGSLKWFKYNRKSVNNKKIIIQIHKNKVKSKVCKLNLNANLIEEYFKKHNFKKCTSGKSTFRIKF